MKILITGVAGFIGFSLAKDLLENSKCKIYGIDNLDNYYSSNKNLNIKKYNLNNINQIISKKASNLPVLSNDTNDVIEFNNSISSEVINAKPRSFWNLLKLK